MFRMDTKTLAIIGGGAAGLAAAVAAARAAKEAAAPLRVVVLEADERVGRSILATGNGRCNFTNARIEAGLYRNADFVAGALESLEARAARQGAANAVQAFFASLGLVWREEGEGRMYPYANKASSVLDVLRGAAAFLGVEERCECPIAFVDAPRGSHARFTLRTEDGEFIRADAVVVACGGRAAHGLLPSFDYEHPRAVLGPLATDARLARQLDNIRVRCDARLLRAGEEVACERGEVLFRKYGLSGIAVFNLSRFARRGDVVRLDLLPSLEASELEAWARARYKTLAFLAGGSLTCGAYARGLFLRQVARVVLKHAGFGEDVLCARADAPLVIAAFKEIDFAVEGMADERQCQVHRGGFSVGAVDPCSMRSREVPGLYLAGEALDVDAPCGGYNLHWAWASGMLAGRSAAAFLGADVFGEDVVSDGTGSLNGAPGSNGTCGLSGTVCSIATAFPGGAEA